MARSTSRPSDRSNLSAHARLGVRGCAYGPAYDISSKFEVFLGQRAPENISYETHHLDETLERKAVVPRSTILSHPASAMQGVQHARAVLLASYLRRYALAAQTPKVLDAPKPDKFERHGHMVVSLSTCTDDQTETNKNIRFRFADGAFNINN